VKRRAMLLIIGACGLTVAGCASHTRALTAGQIETLSPSVPARAKCGCVVPDSEIEQHRRAGHGDRCRRVGIGWTWNARDRNLATQPATRTAAAHCGA